MMSPEFRNSSAAGGDGGGASADKGRQLIDAEAEHLAELLVELSGTPWSDSFPYRPE